MGQETSGLPHDVLEILVDPEDKGPLHYFESESFLYNDRKRVRYPVGPTGIAVLLTDEAESVSDDEHQRLADAIANGRATPTATKASA